jgi:hypothetical protein
MREPRGYPTAVVTTALGLLGLIIYIVCVISLAAAVTWLVVKLLPAKDTSKPTESQSPS